MADRHTGPPIATSPTQTRVVAHTFYSAGMDERVEHWFNRRYGIARRDVLLIRTPTGWRGIGREGGADGREIPYYFDTEADARRMVKALLDGVPPHLSDWALMPQRRRR